VYTGWLKKVSCCTVSTAYFFEPPCMWEWVGFVRESRPGTQIKQPLCRGTIEWWKCCVVL